MKPIVKLLLIVPILLWSSVAAADFRAGVEAYERGDYATAYKEWLPLAEQGLAEAQFNLGLMYANGDGVPEDDAAAVTWYRKAAEQGDAEAQYNLGVKYAKGEGVPEDDAEAVKWYRKAAEQGQAEAQHNLGVMYDAGDGVPEDDAEVVKWYRKAAEQGYARAQFNLGLMYDTGDVGLDLDLLEALGVAEPHLLHLAVEHRELVLAVRPLAEQGHDVGNGAGGESQ